jgi:hypothetical protein
MKENLKNFLVWQIKLYANLCFGRNYFCRAFIKKILPYRAVQQYIWDENIEKDIRASLIFLIDSCYVDMKPRLERKVPNLVFTS